MRHNTALKLIFLIAGAWAGYTMTKKPTLHSQPDAVPDIQVKTHIEHPGKSAKENPFIVKKTAEIDATKTSGLRAFPAPKAGVEVDAASAKDLLCKRNIEASNGLTGTDISQWCALHKPFEALMIERVNPDLAESPHSKLCEDALEALRDAQEMSQKWGDCGAMAEYILDWADTAWMTGCIDDTTWIEYYRSFRLQREQWLNGGPLCHTTQEAWTNENTDREWRLNAADLSEIKLCVFVVLKVFKQDNDDVNGLTNAMKQCYDTYPDPEQMVPLEDH